MGIKRILKDVLLLQNILRIDDLWHIYMYFGKTSNTRQKRVSQINTDWKNIGGQEVCREISWINNLYCFHFKDAYAYLPVLHPRRIKYSKILKSQHNDTKYSNNIKTNELNVNIYFLFLSNESDPEK